MYKFAFVVVMTVLSFCANAGQSEYKDKVIGVMSLFGDKCDIVYGGDALFTYKIKSFELSEWDFDSEINNNLSEELNKLGVMKLVDLRAERDSLISAYKGKFDSFSDALNSEVFLSDLYKHKKVINTDIVLFVVNNSGEVPNTRIPINTYGYYSV